MKIEGLRTKKSCSTILIKNIGEAENEKKKLCLLGLILLFCMTLLHAEELDTMKISSQVELDEVVVQIFKQNKRLESAPLAASAVNSAMLRNRE
jgi:hypothetical protein